MGAADTGPGLDDQESLPSDRQLVPECMESESRLTRDELKDLVRADLVGADLVAELLADRRKAADKEDREKATEQASP